MPVSLMALHSAGTVFAHNLDEQYDNEYEKSSINLDFVRNRLGGKVAIHHGEVCPFFDDA